MIRAALVPAMLALSCISASSASSVTADFITQSGYGDETCGKWIQQHQAAVGTVGTPESIASDQWVSGYLDGLAKFTNEEGRKQGSAGIDMLKGLKASTMTLMGDFCRGHADRTIQQAISALSAQMIATAPPQPGATPDTVKVSGYGDETCVKWTRLHHDTATPDSTASDHWILGYLDAIARYKNSLSQMTNFPGVDAKAPPSDMLRGLDKQATLALLEDYCAGNAQRTIQDAVGNLSDQLIANELPVQSRRTVR